MKWISVKDKLPELFKVVLVYCPGRENEIFAADYIGGSWAAEIGDGFVSKDDFFGDNYIPTHWQPLPEPPKD